MNLNLEMREVLSQITIGYNEYDKISIEPLIHLLTLPWWSRMWVVQETSLALAARVVWGSNEIYWGILRATLGYLSNWLHFQSIHLMGDESYHRSFFLLERSQPYWVPIVGAWERIYRRPDNTKTKLIDMLLQTSVSSASTATDPRDNIFALMGLVEDDERIGIPVDYSQNLRTVYENTGRALLRTEGLKVLQCCQFSVLHQSGDLPSWIPDWSSSLRPLLDGLLDTTMPSIEQVLESLSHIPVSKPYTGDSQYGMPLTADDSGNSSDAFCDQGIETIREISQQARRRSYRNLDR